MLLLHLICEAECCFTLEQDNKRFHDNTHTHTHSSSRMTENRLEITAVCFTSRDTDLFVSAFNLFSFRAPEARQPESGQQVERGNEKHQTSCDISD